MRTKSLIATTAFVLAACAGSGTSVNRTPYEPACCSAEGHAVATQHRVSAITNRRFTHANLWSALENDLQSDALTVATVGRSMLGRPIRAVSFGRGPTTVLLWSQMHGNESTATMALADLIAWFASDTPAQAALQKKLESKLRIVMIPMLNPDGSELFQR